MGITTQKQVREARDLSVVAVIDEIKQAMFDLMYGTDGLAFDEMLVILRHANEFESLPTFIESFDYGEGMGHAYKATLESYQRMGGTAKYVVVQQLP